MIQGRCVESMSTLSTLLQGDGFARREIGEEFTRIDAVRSVVRTGIDAARLVVIKTEIAGGCLVHLCDLVPGLREIFNLHLERMHIDIPVGAVAGAQSTSNAPVLDDYLQTVLAAD